MNALWSGKRASVSPIDIKRIVEFKTPSFQGYGQHDSHEFMSFWLDGLLEDTCTIKKKPYVPEVEAAGRPDAEVAADTWAGHFSRQEGFVSRSVTGLLKSRITCNECEFVSTKFDPFTSLLLPIPAPSPPRSVLLYGHSFAQPFRLDAFSFPNSDAFPARAVVDWMLGSLVAAGKLRPGEVKAEHVVVGLVETKATLISHIVPHDVDPRAVERASGRKSDVLVMWHVPTFTGAEGGGGGPGFKRTRGSDVGAANVTDVPYYALFDTPEKAARLTTMDTEDDVSAPVMSASASASTPQQPMLEAGARGPSASCIAFACVLSAQSRSSLSDVMALRIMGDDGTLITNSALHKLVALKLGRLVTQDYRTPDGAAAPTSYTLSFLGSPPTLSAAVAAQSATAGTPVPDNADVATCCAGGGLFAVNVKPGAVLLDEGKQFVPIKAEPPRKSTPPTLASCLAAFSEEEQLTAGNEWRCPRCKKEVLAWKKLSLWRTPDVLIIALKRFEKKESASYMYYGRAPTKISTRVEYPISGLDMAPWLLSLEGRGVGGGADADAPNLHTYNLYAVSEHHGSTGGGHYTAHAKNYETGTWHKFDDSYVSTSQAGVHNDAYVLFYERGVHGPGAAVATPPGSAAGEAYSVGGGSDEEIA